jgi:hypothetical protein
LEESPNEEGHAGLGRTHGLLTATGRNFAEVPMDRGADAGLVVQATATRARVEALRAGRPGGLDRSNGTTQVRRDHRGAANL